MTRRPRIAVTGSDRGGTIAWLATATRLRQAGARPVRLRPRDGPRQATFDGLVLGGGADVDPERYGGERREAPSRRLHGVEERDLAAHRFRRITRRLSLRPFKRMLAIGATPIDPERDAMEIDLFERAVADDLPVLGICRGAQLINVIQGGTLHQDLRDSELNPSSRYGIRAKDPIHVTPGTRLHDALGTTRLAVNSLHNQAVDRPGRGLRVVAHDLDSIVEGIEMPERRFVLGVQWHPEYLPGHREQERLFAVFVRETGGFRVDAVPTHGEPRRGPMMLQRMTR